MVPGQYVVVFKNEFAGEVAAAAHALTAAHGGTLLHTYRHALRGFSARLSAAAAASAAGTWGALGLVYANGGGDSLTPELDAGGWPTGVLFTRAGANYRA